MQLLLIATDLPTSSDNDINHKSQLSSKDLAAVTGMSEV